MTKILMRTLTKPQHSTTILRGREGKILLGVISVLILLGISFFLLFHGPANEAIITISPGMTSGEIAELLAERDLVRSPTVFRIVTKIGRVDDKLKAGTYRLNSNMGTVGIVQALARGDVQLVRFTVPEGLSVKDIANLLEARGLASRERFIHLAGGHDPDFKIIHGDMEFSGNLEGYLFPDTYTVETGIAEEELIKVMVRRFMEAVLPEWSQEAVHENARKLGLHGVITLASIIEKEAKLPEERPLVASVFYNRLRLNMPLQSCATVQFALGTWKDQLTHEDLKVDSPYNTYIRPGLPPGPIASPGLSSVRAALRPADSDYLYFTADQKGGHIFSKTFGDHQKATAQVKARD
ncbi:MAG: endolytic transglycosylase MltG [Firmicutes bacterium]|nr:endolytic transglycosylase MltG [Bacillota bacterium]